MLVYRQRERGRTHFARPADMPPLLHTLLIQRGIASPEEARAFLNPGEGELLDPMRLSSMPEAVARIRRALGAREKICVYGDYDVDGVGAAAILCLHLKGLGANVRTYLPSRHGEGYGLNEGAIRALSREATLLITVDCGVGAAELVELAKSLGMDVVVTDHHRPGGKLPDCPVVNPLLGDYPFPSLCGAGVALKLVEALSGREAALEYVDLAALSTVADVVPLVGENRSIVHLGLARMNARPRPGIQALRKVSGIEGRAITAGHLGFQLGPRLNAGGRLGSAERALRLLLSEDASEAEGLARELDAENAERRRVEGEILREAEEMLESFDFPAHRAIVLSKEGWNAGVLGLAASRLVERYRYPTILLTAEGEVLKGSCRSIDGVDIFRALTAAGEHLERFGGHSMAAGLQLARPKLPAFREALERELFATIPAEAYLPVQDYDLSVSLEQLDAHAVASLERMQPTGIGNPAPVLRARGAVAGIRRVGREGTHLKLSILSDDSRFGAVLFSGGARADELSGEYDLLFAPKINAWQGRAEVELELRALNPLSAPARISANLPRREALVVRFLTEVLYNRGAAQEPPERCGARALREALTHCPQGALLIARDFEQATFLLNELDGMPLDVYIGAYPRDPRAFNALSLLPAGDPPRNYRRVIAAEEILGAPEVRWRSDLPDVDALREAYRALRALGRRPLIYSGLAQLAGHVAAECDLPPIGCAASLLALEDMRLIELADGARFKILPMEKRDPMDSAVFQAILRLRAGGREDSGHA